jgi:hypothetical protein
MCGPGNPPVAMSRHAAAALRRFTFILYLTLNLMAFYGIMGVYVTPNLVVASVLSGFFYGAPMSCDRRSVAPHDCCGLGVYLPASSLEVLVPTPNTFSPAAGFWNLFAGARQKWLTIATHAPCIAAAAV